MPFARIKKWWHERKMNREAKKAQPYRKEFEQRKSEEKAA